MNIQYSKKKQEERSDPVMEFFFTAKDWIKKNQQIVSGLGIAAAVVFFAAFGWQWYAKNQLAKAQDLFGTAMISVKKNDQPSAKAALEKVTQEAASSPQAAYASFMLGRMLLDEGKYVEAGNWFTKAKASPEAFIAGSAIEGLANCAEAQGNVDQAVALLKESADKPGMEGRKPALQFKIALLLRQQNKTDDALTYARKVAADTAAVAQGYREKASFLAQELALSSVK